MHRRIAEALVWWVALCAVELLLVSSVSAQEAALAVVLSLAAALVAVAARTAQPTAWSPRVTWLRWLLMLPGSVVGDTRTVLVAAFSGRRGTWRTIDVLQAIGDGARPRAWRALAGLCLTASPSTVVADIDQRSGRVLLHDLAWLVLGSAALVVVLTVG